MTKNKYSTSRELLAVGLWNQHRNHSNNHSGDQFKTENIITLLAGRQLLPRILSAHGYPAHIRWLYTTIKYSLRISLYQELTGRGFAHTRQRDAVMWRRGGLAARCGGVFCVENFELFSENENRNNRSRPKNRQRGAARTSKNRRSSSRLTSSELNEISTNKSPRKNKRKSVQLINLRFSLHGTTNFGKSAKMTKK